MEKYLCYITYYNILSWQFVDKCAVFFDRFIINNAVVQDGKYVLTDYTDKKITDQMFKP